MPLKVLIADGGIAGPFPAFWLARLGHQCIVLERQAKGLFPRKNIVYDATNDTCEYRFGVSVKAFDDEGERVKVEFSDGTKSSYDLLVGADGQESRIRRTMLGKDADEATRHPLGLIVLPARPRPARPQAGHRLPCALRRVMMTRWHEECRGQAYLFTMVQTEELKPALRGDVARQKKAFAKAPLTSMGTSLAMIGAYVLAGEIARHADDVRDGLAAYEKRLRPYVEKIQALPPGIPGIIYPESEWGVKLLYELLGIASAIRVDKAIATFLSNNLTGKWQLPAQPGEDVVG